MKRSKRHISEYLVKKYYKTIKNKTSNKTGSKSEKARKDTDINIYNSIKILCQLCPNNCLIANDKAGLCNTRLNIDGKLYSIVYGYPCSIHVDPVEKKPLYHYYPGQEILSFGTYGCNLFCKGCQNFDITRIDKIEQKVHNLKYYSPEDIVNIALENNIKLIAYTYNEPTIFFEYMIDIAKLARKKGIKNVIVSNGYINPEPLKELCKYIDAANIDLKGINENFYKEYSESHLLPILETIKTLHKKGIWLELTNLIIHGLNDDAKDIKILCEWITKNVGADVPLHFSRFYPYYKALNIPPTNPGILENAKNIALKSGIKYVYIGNLGVLDNTICRKCGIELIQRDYARISVENLDGKDKNRCIKCGQIMVGVFK
jgi:pyruvate formate lyase activating enzyme